MSESDESTPNTPKSNPMNFSAEFAAQFAEFLRQSLNTGKPPNQPPNQPESLGEIILKTKLDGDNYPPWANLMERAIGGKGLTSHVTGGSDPPSTDDPKYPKWQQRDHCCFNWIINNIEASLVNEVSRYATAKDLWEGQAITYGSGTDPFQVYDLHRQVYTMKQGDITLDELWNKFQDLWISIDTRDPNPMDTPTSIEKHNQHTQRHRLYQFLWALDDRYDSIRKEMLNKDPLPTVRKAYGIVRREIVNERVVKPPPTESRESGIGAGLGAFDRNRPGPSPTAKFPANRKEEEDKSKLTCSHCGGNKHTRETCFHIHGYPEWWEEMKRAQQNRNRGGSGGRAAPAVAVGDRATYTDNSAGGIGTNLTTTGKNGDEKSREEEWASASVSVARAWTEGKTTARVNGTGVGAAAGVGGAGDGAAIRIGIPGGAAARVRKWGAFGLNTPAFGKLENPPQTP